MRFYHNNGKLIAGLLVLFLFTISCSVKAQLKEMNPLSKIKIEIQNTKKGVTLKAMEGCAWSVLGFNLTEGQSQNIDNFGMVGQNDPLAVNTSRHSDFLITITKTRGLQAGWHQRNILGCTDIPPCCRKKINL